LLIRDAEAVEPSVESIEAQIERGKVPRDTAGLVAGMRGWALAEQGAIDRGLALMLDGHALWQSMYGAWLYPLDGALAEILGAAGRIEEGLDVVQRTLDAAAHGGAEWWNAELLRVRAGLRRAMGSVPAAESDFEAALARARSQGARWFELRAARDLARLWSDQGKTQEAVQLLSPVCAGLREEGQEPDLMEATSLLEQLR
jgi:predicted ATPase